MKPLLQGMLKAGRSGLLFALVCSCSASDAQRLPDHTIALPGTTHPGSFGGFLSRTSASDYAALRVAPDQSVLLLEPTADGRWALVRVRDWWTAQPQIDSLMLQVWSAADTRSHAPLGDELEGDDLQISPDGHYAVVLANLERDARRGQPRSAMTSITAVDLGQWRVITSIRTSDDTTISYRGARVLAGDQIALQGLPLTSDGTYLRLNRILSLPDLRTVTTCQSTRQHALLRLNASSTEWKEVLDEQSRRNDIACRDLLLTANLQSVESLESKMYRGTEPEPESLAVERQISARPSAAGSPRLLKETTDRQEFTYDRWAQPHYGPPADLPAESADRDWYFASRAQEPIADYALERLSSTGATKRRVGPGLLLCSRPGRSQRDTCECQAEAIDQSAETLMVSCLSFYFDSFGVEHDHLRWKAFFHADDLTAIASIDLSLHRDGREVMASVDNKPYLLVIDSEKVLRVFRVSADN